MRLVHVKSLNCVSQQARRARPRLTGIAVDQRSRLLAIVGQEIWCYSAEGELAWQMPTPSPAWSLTAADESLWVGMRGSIGRFDLQGRLLDQIDDPDRLGRITGLAVRGEVLLAADATNRTIHVYRQAVWQGEVGREVNTRGFMLPNGMLDLALDASSATIVVAHPQKHRVERYQLDGKLVDKFGRFGMQDPGDFGGCCNPTHITVTAQGWIAVSEKAPPRIKIYAGDGEYLTQSAETVFDPNTKNIDLAADSSGRLYATDPYRCAIEQFQLEPLGE
ncbi:MAG: hypothetical protein ACR2NM_15175 [Bythopirellula sp.]